MGYQLFWLPFSPLTLPGCWHVLSREVRGALHPSGWKYQWDQAWTRATLYWTLPKHSPQHFKDSLFQPDINIGKKKANLKYACVYDFLLKWEKSMKSHFWACQLIWNSPSSNKQWQRNIPVYLKSKLELFLCRTDWQSLPQECTYKSEKSTSRWESTRKH